MGITGDEFAARVAMECETAAATLSTLQDHFSKQVVVSNEDALFRDVQSLDTVQQTLADLADIFTELSVFAAANPSVIPESIFERAQQVTLRARLSGHKVQLTKETIELF
ncbi:hypothetical protein SAMN05444004_11592 [Jannaschia faecimaris]|uniref:Uncharacterized protein n=1 Tax=Jannaschia faecimaris TaxID=1244108 RepID=A0A1H3TAD1_9RHOB|nr:hypothetical protein [Jannaschia faecimaris]SDZ46685.1 hypothetical protein SAMN05444004_11592 [Jannaschia faecimaris]